MSYVYEGVMLETAPIAERSMQIAEFQEVLGRILALLAVIPRIYVAALHSKFPPICMQF